MVEQNRFEKWTEWRKIALFWIFQLSRLWCEEQKLTIFSSETCLELGTYGCRPWWKRRSLSFGELWVCMSKKIEPKKFSLEFLDHEDSHDEREKNNDFLNEFLVYECCVLHKILNGGNRTCSVWELEVWISIDIKKSCTFWNI